MDCKTRTSPGRVHSLSPEDLASRLTKGESLLPIDCRNACERVSASLPNSATLVCPFLLRRRLRKGSVSVSEVVSNAAAVTTDIDDTKKPVLLYSETCEPLSRSQASPSILAKVTDALAANGSTVFVLEGGLQAFRSNFSHLCVPSEPASSPSGTSGAVKEHVKRRIMLPLKLPSKSNSTSSNSCDAVPPASPQPPTDTIVPPGTLGHVTAPFFPGSVPLTSALQRPETPKIDLFAPMSEVLDHVYIGNRENANDIAALLDHKVSGILNCAAECVPGDNSQMFQYKHLQLQDTMSQEILPSLDEAFSFIESVRRDGGRVLVHCRGGISRSVAVVVAYVMRSYSVGLDVAYARVRSARPNSSPNINFMQQLIEYERSLVADGLIEAPRGCLATPPVTSGTATRNSSAPQFPSVCSTTDSDSTTIARSFSFEPPAVRRTTLSSIGQQSCCSSLESNEGSEDSADSGLASTIDSQGNTPPMGASPKSAPCLDTHMSELTLDAHGNKVASSHHHHHHHHSHDHTHIPFLT